MELNNIPKTGSYGDGVDLHNDNYQKIGLKLETLENTSTNQKGYFENLSSLQSKYPTPQPGWQAYVKDAGSSTGYYVANVNSSGNWVVTSAEAPAVGANLNDYALNGGSEKTVKDVEDEIVQLAGKTSDIDNKINSVVDFINLFNPNEFEFDRRYSTGYTNIVKASETILAASSGLVKVEEGEWYTVSGAGIYASYHGGYFGSSATGAIGDAAISNITFVETTNGVGRKFQVPTGQNIRYVLISLATNSSHTALAGNAQIERGEIATDYTEGGKIKPEVLPTDIARIEDVNAAVVEANASLLAFENEITTRSKNLLDNDVSNFMPGTRLNTNGTFVASTNNIAVCKGIPVKKNVFYSVSGAFHPYSPGNPRGAVSPDPENTTSRVVLTFEAVSGGFKFISSIDGFLFIDFRLNTSLTAIESPTQIEVGEAVTSYVPYENSLKIKESVLPEITTKINKLSILSIPPQNHLLHKKLPNFYRKWRQRLQDIMIVVYGDSLSVRATNNTEFDNPKNRPPLCSHRNFASAVWDKLKWGWEKFYRYDTDRFTEVGSFVTVLPNPTDTPSQGISSAQWDDFVRREGYTRMFSGSGTASVTFNMIDSTVDKEGCLDFIYRTDLQGAQICTVSVAEGNGRLKVWDKATDAYMEANGYTFSMRHDAVSTYRGNTKFNERLIFKAVVDDFDSRNRAKTITITKTDTSDSRFMYWGIQTSTERYMMRIVSAGRGGLALPTLLPFIDDDVYDHNPDLIVHEVPINGGINIVGNQPATHWRDQWNTWFFDTSNAKSIKSNSKLTEESGYWSKYEALVWTPHATENTFLDDNTFVSQKFSDQNWYSVADNRYYISMLHSDNDEIGVYFVDMFQRWLLESEAIYGSKKAGFLTTSTTSEESFIRDGTHMNDLGVKIMNKHIMSIFD